MLLLVMGLGEVGGHASFYPVAYLAGTVGRPPCVAEGAGLSPAAGAGVAVVLRAGALGMIVLGESSFGVLVYGPLTLVLTALVVTGGWR